MRHSLYKYFPERKWADAFLDGEILFRSFTAQGLPDSWAKILWFVGAATALGLFTAGVANLLEDWFGLQVFGIPFVGGILVGSFGLIPTGVGLALGSGTRWIALGPLLSFTGLIFVSMWWGMGILAATWIALGALQSFGRLR